MLMHSKSLEPLIIKLFKRASSQSDSTIFTFDGEQFTLGQIASEVICVAKHLKNFATRQGFVVLCLENSPMFAVAFLAGNMCNLNVGVFNHLWPGAMIRKALDNLDPDCVIFDAESLDTNCPTVSIRSIDRRGYGADDFSYLAKKLQFEHNIERSFYTGFTSGTSSVPKGFVRSGLSWQLSFEADQREFGFKQKDVFVCPGSFVHSLFLYAFLRALYAGCQVVAYKRFRPDKIIPDIQRMSASVLFVVPTQLIAICELARKKKVKLYSPRLVLSAGAKLNNAAKEVAQIMFPNAEIVEFYGSSEHGYISVSRQTDNPPKESVGRPFDGVKIAIKNAQGRDLEPGQIGQIYVKSPYRFSAYTKTREGASESLPELDGFTGTGDTGRIDGKGFLHLIGRIDRMLICSGRNVYPETVESALLSIQGILHAAVLSSPCPNRGQRLFAIVKFQEGARFTRKELLALARKELPAYAIPSNYFECRDWPMTVSHKTDFQRLKSQVSTGLTEITT